MGTYQRSKKGSKELTLKEYEIFSENLGPLEHLTLGGGEPTLRKDMSDIAILFYKNCGVEILVYPQTVLDQIY